MEWDRRRFDAWLTREPPWDEDEDRERHCTECGGLLGTTPERSESWEDSYVCTGQVTTCTETYTEEDKGLLDIIGWEHLGETYEVALPSACGDDVAHERHKVVVMAGIKEYRACEFCGAENTETVV